MIVLECRYHLLIYYKRLLLNNITRITKACSLRSYFIRNKTPVAMSRHKVRFR